MKKKMLILLSIILFFITGCSSNENTITIYTSMEENRNQALISMLNERFKHLDINVQPLATGSSAAKIKAEGNHVEADIVVALETAHMESLKDNFADLSYFDDSYYLDGVNPEHNKYMIYEKYTASIIVDKDYFEENNLEYPKTYDDLLNPKFKNLIAMPDPKTSGTGYMYYLNVVNIKGQEGALQYFDKLSNNIKQFTTSGSGPISMLNQGEIAIALGMTYQGAEEITKGANYEIIQLETNTPYNTTSSGIIAGRENKANVKEVFEFIMTEFSKYDKENFIPGTLFKEQENNIPNYPKNLADADMTGIDDSSVKDKLISEWKY